MLLGDAAFDVLLGEFFVDEFGHHRAFEVGGERDDLGICFSEVEESLAVSAAAIDGFVSFVTDFCSLVDFGLG